MAILTKDHLQGRLWHRLGGESSGTMGPEGKGKTTCQGIRNIIGLAKDLHDLFRLMLVNMALPWTRPASTTGEREVFALNLLADNG